MQITQPDKVTLDIISQSDCYKTLFKIAEFKAIGIAFQAVLKNESDFLKDEILANYIQVHIRTQLKNFLEIKKYNKKVFEAAFQLTLLITNYWPLNQIAEVQNDESNNIIFNCPITLVEIAEANKAITTQGHLFTKTELIGYWDSKDQFIHPISREILSGREQLYILGGQESDLIPKVMSAALVKSYELYMVLSSIIVGSFSTAMTTMVLLSYLVTYSLATNFTSVAIVVGMTFLTVGPISMLAAYATYNIFLLIVASIANYHFQAEVNFHDTQYINDATTASIISDINTQRKNCVETAPQPGARDEMPLEPGLVSAIDYQSPIRAIYPEFSEQTYKGRQSMGLFEYFSQIHNLDARHQLAGENDFGDLGEQPEGYNYQFR